MVTVRELMNTRQDKDMVTVAPNDPVIAALELMAEKNISAVLVRQGEEIVGIFTERDHLRKITLQGLPPRDTEMQQIMSRDMVTVAPSFSLEACMELMHEHYIRHLPVMENGKLVGMVSMRDVVDAVLANQKNRIEYLETSLTGTAFPK